MTSLVMTRCPDYIRTYQPPDNEQMHCVLHHSRGLYSDVSRRTFFTSLGCVKNETQMLIKNIFYSYLT